MKGASLGLGRTGAATASHVGGSDDYDLGDWNRTPKVFAGVRVACPAPEAVDGAEAIIPSVKDGLGDIHTGRDTAIGYGKTKEMDP